MSREGVYDVLASRFGTGPSPCPQRRAEAKLKQHDRALGKVTKLKNEAHQVFRRAKRLEAGAPTVQSLATKFLSLVRDHSRLKKASSRRFLHTEAKIARQQCRQNFWRYAKGLLDKGSAPQVVSPSCSASDAHSYFTEAYQSTPHHFQTPHWMPDHLHQSLTQQWRYHQSQRWSWLR